MIGLSGEYDQKYNEINASNWMNGLGLCNQYKGTSFINTIPIINDILIFNGKKYVAKKKDFWKIPKCKMKISFDYKVK